MGRPSDRNRASRLWGSLWVVTLAFLLAVTSVPLAANSVLNFPRIDLAPGTLTGIAIVNPGSSSADVTLTLYQSSGVAASGPGITNPVNISIGPESQFAQVISAIFGSPTQLQPGYWLQATSTSFDLTGFFLFLNTQISFFDGADLPTLARELIFDSVRLGNGFSTEINLINPNSSPTQVVFRLVGEGVNAVDRVIEFPALGALRMDLTELFPGVAPAGAPSGPVYVTATSAQEIGGFYFVRGATDLLGLNARPATDVLNTLYFPQMAVLDPFLTELSVVSLSDETELITVTAYRPDGTAFGNDDLQMNPVTRSLEAGEVMRADLETLFGFSGNATLDGWLLVEATSSAIHGSLSYSISATGSVAAVSSETRGRTQAVFSHIATQAGFFTGVAILDATSLAANIRVVALRPNGSLLGTFNTVLRPRQRISMLINEMIPAAANQAGGMILVRSDIPVFLTSLFGASSGVLANIPPQPVPGSFRPDQGQPSLRLDPALAVLSPGSQREFSISGVSGAPTWSVNGVQGGSSTTGTISPAGVFAAPDASPASLPVTIGARLGGQQAGSSVDVLSPQLLVQNRGDIQSLAYLETLQRLYTAELSLVPAAQQGTVSPQGFVSTTTIFDVTEQARAVISLEGEDVRKMVAYQGFDGRPYLLLAARTSGTIIRLDPQNSQTAVVATGLNAPGSLVIDPLTGDLLVAEASRVATIPSADLNLGLAPAGRVDPDGGVRHGVFLGGIAPAGIAVDPCTGNIYISDRDRAEILVFDRFSLVIERVTGSESFGQLLALNRSGVSCPDSLHLLSIDEADNTVRLLIPSQDFRTGWALTPGIRDLTFLPPGSPLAGQGGVLLAAVPNSQGQVENFLVPGLYQPRVPNPDPDPPLPAPLVDITDQGTIFASTTFTGFPASLSVDGDRTTSWFSGGSNAEGRNFSVFEWTTAEEFQISQISVLSNRDHPMFAENFGFNEVVIRVRSSRLFTAGGNGQGVVFEQTIDLAGTPDPDAIVFPGVVGDLIELILTGHESAVCGGFAELQITGRPVI